MQHANPAHSSWQELVAAPPSGSHLVQIYDSEAFLAAVGGFFVAEGLVRGEAVVLNATEPHVRALTAALKKKDVDADAAFARGQLLVSPIPAASVDVLAMASRDPRYGGVRWWGETANFLYQRGDQKGALAAEDIGNSAARQYGAKLLCAFLCDRFDPRSYDAIVQMCERHSHLIPASDYVSHRLAVNRAIAEVLGEIRGPLLQSLLSWQQCGCELPSSQAVLFWLRDTLPEAFAEVLERLKSYHAQQAAACPDS
jgi:DcmR-like sensory protein